MNKMILSALLAACCLARLEPVYGEGGRSVELVSYGSDKLMALVVRPASNLEYRTRICGVWGPWVDLGGICLCPVCAVSWGPDRIDIFVCGLYRMMWHLSFDGANWSGWEDFGGYLPYNVKIGCVSHAPESVTAFALGMGGAVEYYHYGEDGWSGWVSLGGSGTSPVVCSSWGPNHITMFVRGTPSNYRLWQRTWDTTGSWGGWVVLGDQKVGGGIAVASWGPGRLDVFAYTFDREMIHNWYSGGSWETSWENNGGILPMTPLAVVSAKENHLAVFGRGYTDSVWTASYSYADSVWTAIWSGNTWLTGWVEIYGAGKGAVVATVHQGEIHLASAYTTAHVQHTYFRADWEFI